MMRALCVTWGGLSALIMAACSSEVPLGDVRRKDAATSVAGAGGAAGNGGNAGTSLGDVAIDRMTADGNGGAAGTSLVDAAAEASSDGAEGTPTNDGAAEDGSQDGGSRDADVTAPTACEVVQSLVNRASWIAFDSDRDGGSRNLYMVHPDGTELTPLTKGANNDREPFFSYDGTRLSYTSTIAGKPQVFLMNLAARTSVQLTHRAEGADQSTLSRDGSWVAFRSGYSVYVMKTDGTGERVVAVGVGPDADAAEHIYAWPAFSADGSELLMEHNVGIDALRLDGMGSRTVLTQDTSARRPAIVPSGIDIASSSYCGGDGAAGEGIWTSPFDTASSPCKSLGRRITPPDGGISERPSWGTDKVLAYRHRPDRFTKTGVVAMISRGDARPCFLTSGPEDSANPSWSP